MRRPGAWGAIDTYRIPRLPRRWNSYNKSVSIVKTVSGVTWNISYPGTSGVEVFKAYSFDLSDVADYSNYTAVYDQWRIVGISATFMQRQNVIEQLGSSTPQNTAKYAFIATDLDDASTPSSLDTLKGYANCKVWNMNLGAPFKIFFRPAISQAAFAGAAFTGYVQSKTGYAGPWVDVLNPGVSYYGLKVGIPSQGTVTADEWVIDVVLKYYIQFKGQR